MPESNSLSPLIQQELRVIHQKLDEIIKRQDVANGKLATHDNWIAGKEVELEQIEDRQDVAEEAQRQTDSMLRSFQSYMDQRAGALQEHVEMRKQLAGMTDYDEIKGKVEKHDTALSENRGFRRAVAEWCAIATPIIAAILGAVLLNKHG